MVLLRDYCADAKPAVAVVTIARVNQHNTANKTNQPTKQSIANKRHKYAQKRRCICFAAAAAVPRIISLLLNWLRRRRHTPTLVVSCLLHESCRHKYTRNWRARKLKIDCAHRAFLAFQQNGQGDDKREKFVGADNDDRTERTTMNEVVYT